MPDVVMPRLSDSMEEGTILQWLKQVGDEIAIGDELVEIETDKANMAYEADIGGTLSEILVQEGETVAIGTPIATIGDSDGGDRQDDQGSTASAAGPVAGGGGGGGMGGGKLFPPPPPPPHATHG
jgi:pyruvate dehydrogenase E2 component (dihydrolipoamide acetyltransferase)